MIFSYFFFICIFVDKVHIQNCVQCTKVIYNPACAEASELKNRFIEYNNHQVSKFKI